ncbi:hypothetical protein RU01_12550 [Rhodococcus sp. MEB064]|nr:hypothetical protein RU01_12550 [Rhodococcus sp. MEB064]
MLQGCAPRDKGVRYWSPAHRRKEKHMYGWWRTFEHFCEPGSLPVATSEALNTVDSHVKAHADIIGKEAVVARAAAETWHIVHVVDSNGRARTLSPKQAVKYEKARAGGSRGNLGKRPSGESAPSLHLD